MRYMKGAAVSQVPHLFFLYAAGDMRFAPNNLIISSRQANVLAMYSVVYEKAPAYVQRSGRCGRGTAVDRHVAKGRSKSPLRRSEHLTRLDSEVVIHGGPQFLFAPEIPLSCLY